jgi:hypothetical protein
MSIAYNKNKKKKQLIRKLSKKSGFGEKITNPKAFEDLKSIKQFFNARKLK